MPCNQVILNEVEIRVANVDLLARAIGALAENEQLILMRAVRIGTVNGLAQEIRRVGVILVPAGQEYLADRIKQEYSRQAIQVSARKFNWRLQESPRVATFLRYKLTATRRA